MSVRRLPAPEALLKIAAGLFVAGAIFAMSLERREAGSSRAPQRMFTWPALDARCDDLSRITEDPGGRSALPEGFAGVAPFGLDGVAEVALVVEPDPALLRGIPIELEAQPSSPRGEATALVQAARWRFPLERLVEELDEVAADRGWPAGTILDEESDSGHLVDIVVGYDTPDGQVVRFGTNCGRQGWFVFSRVERMPYEAPPCDRPELATSCQRAWELAGVDLHFTDTSPRRLEVEGDTVTVTVQHGSDSLLGSAVQDLLESFTMAAWNEAPPCPDDEFRDGPSPFCSRPLFIDPPVGPFTWTFDRAEPGVAVHIAAAFTPRGAQLPDDPGGVGYDVTITVVTRAG